MKRIYKSFALFCAMLAIPIMVLAQTTDVTSTYLSNADFNTNANFKFDTPASNLGSANEGVNIQVIEGWNRGILGQNSAASTFEYGYAGTLNAPGPIPATGPTGATGSGHAALGISTAWSGTVTYNQSVTLPVGKYSIEYTAKNTGPNASNLSRVGWVPSSGTSVISTRTSFPLNEWITETITFTIYAETSGVVQVGIASTNVGSSGVG